MKAGLGNFYSRKSVEKIDSEIDTKSTTQAGRRKIMPPTCNYAPWYGGPCECLEAPNYPARAN